MLHKNISRIFGKISWTFKHNPPVLLSSIRLLSRSSSMSSNSSVTVAVCQINSTSDRKKNFETCKELINMAASRQAKMVFLPECFDHVGESRAQSIELSETLDGPLMSEYKQLAAEKSLWLSLGGFHEKDISKDAKRVYNSHVVINAKGEIVSVYRKIHLFDIDIAGSVRLKESDYTIPGKEVCPPVDTPIGKVGLGICYDLRFPEFSLSLTKAGAEILTYPSAFTQTTGMAHWESLLRSRAIESQCYAIASAQTGRHNPKRVSYGHALVVDPWGCVIASCSENVGVVFADINREYVRKIRTEMPIWEHRRSELYGAITAPDNNNDTKGPYMFATIELHPDYIFYKTKLSMAFVNLKPIVPGHVLLTPIRCAKRLSDLSQVEVADLFACVQTVQKKIEEEYNAESSSVAIQDGPDAGQTVPHIHVHILPRRAGDFQRNDDVYLELDAPDKSQRKSRSQTEMIEEAKRLKLCF